MSLKCHSFIERRTDNINHFWRCFWILSFFSQILFLRSFWQTFPIEIIIPVLMMSTYFLELVFFDSVLSFCYIYHCSSGWSSNRGSRWYQANSVSVCSANYAQDYPNAGGRWTMSAPSFYHWHQSKKPREYGAQTEAEQRRNGNIWVSIHLCIYLCSIPVR